MKKLVIIGLIIVSLFLTVSCGNKDTEAAFKEQFLLKLAVHPDLLANFLFTSDELGDFVEVDMEDSYKTIETAAAVFSEDKGFHLEALNRANEVLTGMTLDRNFDTYMEYEDFMYLNYITPMLPIDAETGEPISSEPSGFWIPPEDLLTEEEKEFRAQVIEVAGLDEDSPDFEEQLAKIYNAKTVSDYPNYETYKLFVDRFKAD